MGAHEFGVLINFGNDALMPIFTENESNDFINIWGVVEKEIYAEG